MTKEKIVNTIKKYKKILESMQDGRRITWKQLQDQFKLVDQHSPLCLIADGAAYEQIVDGDYVKHAEVKKDYLKLTCGSTGPGMAAEEISKMISYFNPTMPAKICAGYANWLGSLDDADGRPVVPSYVAAVDANAEDSLLNITLKPIQSYLDGDLGIVENEQLNEFRHDGLHSASNSTRNPTDKATVYYIGVDKYSDNFSGYDGFIRPDGSLTSANDFKHAAVTKMPESLKSMVAKAVARYGKKYYIFVFKEEYSYGMQTHKRHARPSVIDIWYPDGQYWRYGLSAVDGSAAVSESSISSNALKALRLTLE